MKDLKDAQVGKLRDLIAKSEARSKATCDGNRAEHQALIEIGTYRGLRHRRGLPVRGQRTRTNARTRRGPRRPSACAARRSKRRVSHGQEEENRPNPSPRAQKHVTVGQAHIQSTFNNTIVSLDRPRGTCSRGAVPGAQGFKGSRKSTPFAAQVTAEAAASRAMEHGLKSIEIFVKGPGAGREAAIRSLQASGLEITAISDITPIPHNGCRPPKRRGSRQMANRTDPSAGSAAVRESSCTSRAEVRDQLRVRQTRGHPPGQHGTPAPQGRATTASSCAPSSGPGGCTSCWSGSFAYYFDRAANMTGDHRPEFTSQLERGSTTSSTGSASPPLAVMRVSSVSHRHITVNGRT